MKKVLAVIVALLFVVTSCGTSHYVSQRTVLEMDEISYVLYNYYPQLHEYYMEGVLAVTSLKEATLADGTKDYKVKYRFIKYHYPNFNDRMDALREYYPEIYDMYVSGVIELTSFYKYVDRNTGLIRHHVSFRRIYDYYYGPAIIPGYHGYYGRTYHYRPRPVPPRPRPHVNPEPPRPRPDARPGDRPGNQPNTRPNNPPRQQPNIQPSNPPRNPGGQGGVSRPSNPPRQQGGNPGGATRSGGGSSSRGRR